jgi:hypothetical protein
MSGYEGIIANNSTGDDIRIVGADEPMDVRHQDGV